jgi:peptidoglycan/xylan/chitin deacetylase (PgdA/CDA1 family)
MNTCKIVMYHYVRPIANSSFSKIKGLELEDFKTQIKFFKKNFHFISIQDILDSVYKHNSLPKNSILLTFDDGLKDHFNYVFPILEENNIQGIFFPPGKPIIEKIVLDTHKIHFILATISNTEIIIDQIKKYLKKFKKNINIKTFDFYYKKFAYQNRFDSKEINFIKKFLQQGLPLEFREDLVSQLFTKYVTDREKDFSENLYLSMNDINSMKKKGMIFGSHSYSHYWMDTLTESKLIQDFANNKEFLLKISGDNLLMCYPYGSYNDIIIKKLDECNFQLGLTTEVGDTIVDNKNRFKLKRFDCNDFPPMSSKITYS